MGNTKIDYIYRDASNYKAYPGDDVIVSGELSESDIIPHTREDNRFIPADIDLPELQSQLEGYPGKDDHIWHELLSLELTEEKPTLKITGQEIKNRLKKIAKTGWDENAAFKRHHMFGGILE
jgi:hypothetical protein